MRKMVRAHSTVDGSERLARVIAGLPQPAREALAVVAEREDLPLMAGSWSDDVGGCLVANVVTALGGEQPLEDLGSTLDVRVLTLIAELSSRDLNRLIVAWDEAALAERAVDDRGLRALLRRSLARADALLVAETLPRA